MATLILDASIVISWCDELEDLIIQENLEDLGYEFVLSEQVRDEIETGHELYEKVLSAASPRECDGEMLNELSSRHFRLGKGELSVMVLGMQLAEEEENYICVVDDGLARKACEHHDLKYTGNIGLCRILVEEEVMTFDEATETLEQMRDGGSRIPENYADLLCEELKAVNGSRPG